jgi:hypothetical protein
VSKLTTEDVDRILAGTREADDLSPGSRLFLAQRHEQGLPIIGLTDRQADRLAVIFDGAGVARAAEAEKKGKVA